MSAFDLTPSQLEPDINCEAIETTILYIINKYNNTNNNSISTTEVSVNPRLPLPPTINTNIITSEKPSASANINSNTNTTISPATSLDTLPDIILHTLSKILHISTTQIISIYEHTYEGIRIHTLPTYTPSHTLLTAIYQQNKQQMYDIGKLHTLLL